jgi:hypothetical protein
VNDSIHAAELALPKGVELPSRLRKENPVIVTVQLPKAMVVEEEVVAAPVTEIIGEVPAEGEEAPAAEGEKKEAPAEKKESKKE